MWTKRTRPDFPHAVNTVELDGKEDIDLATYAPFRIGILWLQQRSVRPCALYSLEL